MENPIRSATSPDGLLILDLYQDDNLIGLRGQAWHTHGDLLVPQYGPDAQSAANEFFDSVIADQQIICLDDSSYNFPQLWLTHDPEMELSLSESGAITFRYWSGRLIDAGA